MNIVVGSSSSVSSKWGDGEGVCGACSTGAGGAIAPSNWNAFTRCLYGVGTPYVWRGSQYHPIRKNASVPAATWEALVGNGSVVLHRAIVRSSR